MWPRLQAFQAEARGKLFPSLQHVGLRHPPGGARDVEKDEELLRPRIAFLMTLFCRGDGVCPLCCRVDSRVCVVLTLAGGRAPRNALTTASPRLFYQLFIYYLRLLL